MKGSGWLKVGTALLLGAVLYTAAGLLAGPGFSERRVRQFLAAPAGLELAVESTRFNPFTLTAEFDKLSLSAIPGENLLTADRVSASFGLAGLFRQGLNLRELRMLQPELSLEITGRSAAGLSQWVQQRVAGDRPLHIQGLFVQDGTLQVSIAGKPPRTLYLDQITLTGNDVSSVRDALARINLSAKNFLGGSLEVSAEAGLNPPSSSGSFQLQGLDLEQLVNWLGANPRLAAAAGEVAIGGAFRAGGEGPAFALAGLSLQGEKIDLRDAAGEYALRLEDARLGDVDLDFAARLVHATQITLEGGLLAVGSDPGLWPAIESLRRWMGPWKVRAERIQTRGLGLEAAALGGWQLGDIELELTDLDTGAEARSPFTLAMSINQSAQLRAGGWLTAATPALQADLEISALDLRPYASLLGLAPTLELDSGIADGEATLSWSAGAARLNGSGALRELALVDRASRQRFFAAAEVKLIGLQIDGDPPQATIEVARLNQPELQIALDADGRPNPVDLQAGPPALVIKSVEIDDGALNLRDGRLEPPLEITASGIRGAVEGLSGGANGLASLALEGRVKGAATGKLTANWRTGDARREQRIDLLLKGIERSLLEPYATRFAARRIESGTLNLDLRYLFRGERFAARQHFVFDDLRLGERLDPPGAPELPLDLAVALLRDGDGRIDVTVPAAVNLNPDFNLTTATGRSLLAFLGSLQQAPFRALGALVGDPAGELGTIAFEPGSAAITPESGRRLNALSQAMAERPSLALRIAGGYSGDADRGALAHQQVRLHIALATSAGPPGAGDPGPLAFDDSKVRSVLDEFAGERLAEAQRAAIQARFGAGDRTGYYRALFDALVSNEPIAEPALRKLARYRAQSILGQLASLGVPAERTLLADPVAVAGGGGGEVPVALGVEPVTPAGPSEPLGGVTTGKPRF